MNSITKHLIVPLLCLGIANAYAEEKKEKKEDNSIPSGCLNVGYKFDLKILKLLPEKIGDTQSMYLLFNSLDQPVSLYQMQGEDNSRSLYLNHIIGARQWGILSTSEKDLKFVCTVPQAKEEYGHVIDCATSLTICEYTHVRYGLNNRGNYWLVNSSSRNGAVMSVVHYGIIPAQ